MRLICQLPRSTLLYRPYTVRLCGNRSSQVRCLATKRDDDKTWAEIAEEAGTLVKDIGAKAINGLKTLGTSIVSGTGGEKQRPQPITKAPPTPADLFGGGLVGGLLGKAVGSMMKGVAEQMQQAQERSEDLLNRARFVIQNDNKLQDYLGTNIQLGNPIAQNSTTQVINGRSRNKTSLIVPIFSSKGGQAQAQVEEVDGDVKISVQLANGRVINLGTLGSAGKTIDVDYKEL